MKKTIFLKQGEILVREGEESCHMYFLKTGIVGIYKKKNNTEIQIGTAHNGELVGEMSFIDREPRSATVKAETDCELLVISGEQLDLFLEGIPKWHKVLLKNLVSRLRNSNQKVKS